MNAPALQILKLMGLPPDATSLKMEFHPGPINTIAVTYNVDAGKALGVVDILRQYQVALAPLSTDGAAHGRGGAEQ